MIHSTFVLVKIVI